MSYEESYALDPYAWHDAWEPVLEAIEAAIDVPGLKPRDRAALSALHAQASIHGHRPRLDPADCAPVAPVPAAGTLTALDHLHAHAVDMAEWGRLAKGPGGIRQLNLSNRCHNSLMAYGVATIADLREKRSHGPREILAIPGIGHVALAEIDAALEKHIQTKEPA